MFQLKFVGSVGHFGKCARFLSNRNALWALLSSEESRAIQRNCAKDIAWLLLPRHARNFSCNNSMWNLTITVLLFVSSRNYWDREKGTGKGEFNQISKIADAGGRSFPTGLRVRVCSGTNWITFCKLNHDARDLGSNLKKWSIGGFKFSSDITS